MFKKFLILLLGIDCSKENPIDYDKLYRSPGQSLDEELVRITSVIHQMAIIGNQNSSDICK